ncbi:type III effector [Pseudovibrio sp. Alg231-02]|uniref:type III effector n=1 Tax=Pseudovibrio sp. Alg231-02 TaxID=1922223 RepID=UPI000D54CBC8|nr:type III effector [Pseudovibrio sp. Alg231-02]
MLGGAQQQPESSGNQDELSWAKRVCQHLGIDFPDSVQQAEQIEASMPKADVLSVADNKAVEASMAQIASDSPAAHKTADSLIKSIVTVFTRLEGDDELKGMMDAMQAYTGDNPKYGVVGQLGAGGFTKIVDGAKKGKEDSDVTIREKGTAYFDLSNSPAFRKAMEKIYHSPELQEKMKDIIDIDYLHSFKFGRPRGAGPDSTAPDELKLYTYRNENKQNASENPELYGEVPGSEQVDGPIPQNDALAGQSLTANQRKYRERSKKGGDGAWATAADLEANKRLTEREINFAKTNPRNRHDREDYQFKENKPVKAGEMPKDKVIVEHQPGFSVWDVKDGTGFAKDADLHNKPTVAGPSGTTDRFLTGIRLLGKGVMKELGLEGDNAENQVKELGRWLATGYLVGDEHHSAVEVNLGAANHGLKPQWGSNLYTEPFSEPIKGKGFEISSEAVVDQLETKLETAEEDAVNRDAYRFDLEGGSKGTVSPDGKVKAPPKPSR